MKTLCESTCLAACLLSAVVASGDTHTWVGGSSAGGGWNTASNWRNESGAAECPEKGDTAVFDQYQETVVVSDADFELFNQMGRVRLTSFSWALNYGQQLVLDVTDDVAVRPPICGSGRLIKRGANRVELTSTDTDAAATKPYGFMDIYSLNAGGIKVEGGTLVLCQSPDYSYFYHAFEVAQDATLVLSSNRNTCVAGFYGKGTVVQPGSEVRTLQIHYSNEAISDASERPFPGAALPPLFEGRFSGALSIDVCGAQQFAGSQSDFSGRVSISNGRGKAGDYGWAYFERLGSANQPSSCGSNANRIQLFHGGSIGYLGDGTPETSDRTIQTEMRDTTGLYPQYFDAGTNGNLTLTGALNTDHWGDTYNMRSFVFTGSNAAPCTVSGPYQFRIQKEASSYDYNLYTRKEGPGTWAFRYNPSTTFRGVFDVREGVLQFDSIAETNVNCALGYATRLTREFTGRWDASYDSVYAYRVGTTNLPNAAAAVFEFNGSKSCSCATRPLLLTGDAHLRANGTEGAAFAFSGVTSEGGVRTLTLDGDSAASNTLSEVSEGAGTLTLVKDGAGTWILDGNHAVSGDLRVRRGTLLLRGRDPFKYFKVTYWDDVKESPYGSPYGGYLCETALYSATGGRVNYGLAFDLPDGKSWGSGGSMPADVAANLAAGRIAFGPGGCYFYQNYPLSNLTDGSTSLAAFSNCFKTSPASVVMRLPDDADEVRYFDFAQSAEHYLNEGYQTPSAFSLEGSADGVSWTELVSRTSLPYVGNRWYFSASGLSLSAAPRDRTVGNGEGLELPVRAQDETQTNLLSDVQFVTVAPGAVLEGVGKSHLPVLSKLRIDAAGGMGRISGLSLASEVTVDVVGSLRGVRSLPVDLTGVSNFDNVTWKFLLNGVEQSRYAFAMGRTALTVGHPGGMLICK